MRINTTFAAILALGGAVVAAAATSPIFADGLRARPVQDALTRKECGACHMVYPAGLLPARSWRAMMAGLDDHFGDNASLDAEATQKIAAYLEANAADAGGARSAKILRDLDAAAAPLRVTETPFWKRKHEKRDRVAAATLKRKGAKSKSDCKACHEGAEQGVFEDD